MKKLLIYLLLSIVLLAGCASSNSNENDKNNTNGTTGKETSESVDNKDDDTKDTTSKNSTGNENIEATTEGDSSSIIDNSANDNSQITTDTGTEIIEEPEVTTDVKEPVDSEVIPSPDKKEEQVVGKVQLYAGNYFDSRRYGEYKPNPYCEIEISNITDTSFDFAIYQVEYTNLPNSDEKQRDIIFLQHTAVFIEDGTIAAFYGNDYTLYFTFPNNHSAYPIVTDMQITGFAPVEGNTYLNNGIPGHEFG